MPLTHFNNGVYLGAIGEKIRVTNVAEDIQAAINLLGDRRTRRHTERRAVTLVNGSATVTSTALSDNAIGWRSGRVGFPGDNSQIYRVDDLIRFGTDTRYYKIKELVSDTVQILYEPYIGGASTSTIDVNYYYIDWATVLIMPNQYPIGGAYVPVGTSAFRSINLLPGISLVGMDSSAISINESSAVPAVPITNFGENRLYNLQLSPTNRWGVLDGCITNNYSVNDGKTSSSAWDNSYHWGDQQGYIEGCVLDIRDLSGAHAGGDARIGFVPNGTVTHKNCRIINDNYSGYSSTNVSGMDVTQSVTNTKIRMLDTVIEVRKGFELSGANQILTPYNIICDQIATYTYSNLELIFTGIDIDASASIATSGIGGIRVSSASIVNLDNVRCDIDNNGNKDTVGVIVEAAATVNITHCNLEVSGTTNSAVYSNNAGATVNIRQSRLKGATNAIRNVAGTVTIDQATADGRVGLTVGTVAIGAT